MNDPKPMNEKHPSPGEPMMANACRETGKAVLKNKIQRMQRKVDQLQMLYDMLPERPTPVQDEALWSLFCERGFPWE